MSYLAGDLGFKKVIELEYFLGFQNFDFIGYYPIEDIYGITVIFKITIK